MWVGNSAKGTKRQASIDSEWVYSEMGSGNPCRNKKNRSGTEGLIEKLARRRSKLRLPGCYGFTITFTAPSSLSEKIFSALLNSVSGKV